MEINEDYLTGTVYNGSITVLGWTRMKGSKRIYAIQCSECGKDTELFNEGVFETSKDSLEKGYSPCGCGQSYRYSKGQYEVLISRKAEELGVVFLGWAGEFKTGGTKCRMSCGDGEWTPRARLFIYKGHIAFNRGKKTKEDSLIIEKFFATGAFHPNTKFTRHRKYDKWYWKVDCPICMETGYSQSQHLQRGSRCCSCGNYKQKFSYLTLIKDGDLPVAVKFGISRSKDMRLKYQMRETHYLLESIGIWEYATKDQCTTAEMACKEDFDCGVLSKQEFGDGYTETTHVYNIENIIRLFEEFGGIRVEIE